MPEMACDWLNKNILFYSDCVDVQADLHLYCSHMAQNRFSHNMAGKLNVLHSMETLMKDAGIM